MKTYHIGPNEEYKSLQDFQARCPDRTTPIDIVVEPGIYRENILTDKTSNIRRISGKK